MDDLPRQLANRLPLKCGKCKHTDRIDIVADRRNGIVEIHCNYCGNFATVGMKTRWPFTEVVKQESQNIELSKNVNPAQQEVSVGTYGKKCEASGCEKKSWLKGLCHKHYIEKHGEYIPENPFKGPKKKAEKVETKRAVTETIPPETETNSVEYVSVDHKTIPLLQIFLEPELLDALTKRAKAEYRSVEMQAAYILSKGL